MSAHAAFARRLAGFASLPVLSITAPFLILPILARLGGQDGWAAVNIGQAMGAVAGLVCAYGWPLTGPVRLAATAYEERRRLYHDSVITRAVALAVVGPVVTMVALLVAPAGEQMLTAATTIAVAVAALSPAWYAIGVGSPGLLAWYDAFPRVLGAMVAAILLLSTEWLLWYPLALGGTTLIGVFLFGRRIGRPEKRVGSTWRMVKGQLWRDRGVALTILAGGFSSIAPSALLAIVATPSAVAAFSSAEKLYRVGLLSVQALGNACQGWVAEANPATWTRRMSASLLAHFAVGAGGALAMATLGPWLTRQAFGSEVQADFGTTSLLGVAFLGICMASACGRVIMPVFGAMRALLRSSIVGVSVGVPATLILGFEYGAAGAAAGIALAELGVAVIQGFAVVRIRPRVASERRL